MFDPPATVPYMNIDEKQLDSSRSSSDLARRIANESMVLLKNDGVLPLKSAKRVAIVGPLADQTAVLLGNYNGGTSHTVTVLEGMKTEFPEAKSPTCPALNSLSNKADPMPSSVLSPRRMASLASTPNTVRSPALTQSRLPLPHGSSPP